MFDFDFSMLVTGQYHEMLVAGFKLSLYLLGTTLVFAVPIAILIALFRLSPLKPLQWIGAIFVESMRNIPLLALMLFWYFGVPEVLPQGMRTWLYAGNIEVNCAIAALTCHASAYMAEELRSGIRAVPKVQMEAVRALGFGFVASMRRVILPQAVRIVIPPFISQTLNLWKDTSIATVIGVAELMYRAAQVESATFRSTEAFVFATVAYLTVSLLITGAASIYQHYYPARAA